MKTESPTEARIETLRDEGIVPISAFACHALGAAGALAVMSVSLERASNPGIVSSIETAKRLATGGILYPLLAYSFMYVAAALLQSRGFFRVVFTRAHFGERNRPGVLTTLFFLSLACALFYSGFRIIPAFAAGIFKAGPDMSLLARKAASISRAFAVAAAAGAAVSALVFRISFLRMHRMTREEVMQESRQ